MKKFPKTIYVRDLNEYDDDDDELDLVVHESQKDALDASIDDEVVAVYQLVKVGRVREQKKIVFE